ncbi:PIG-L deacetylase family protein [Haloferula sp.]|uniref:PIG-L deacetylase family protein n=1 Tax=Haloferula sp. TaxID=2497595 RepID=UPI00329BC50C
MNPYLKFVIDIEHGVAAAKDLAVSGDKEIVESDEKVLLFSPHPDDECITGLLPLRLMWELGKQIINVPVTFGSDEARKVGRGDELKNACNFLGWDLYVETENFQALEVENIVRVLTEVQPELIFMPHSKDWNSRHISTHHLVVDALRTMPDDFCCTVVETEFWGAMDDPNLMIEGDAQMVADLVAATSLHTEEVSRNPYHLSLPAWMQDNVRRGGELVGGQGAAAPEFSFATLYRLRQWANGGFIQCLENGSAMPVGAENLMEIF